MQTYAAFLRGINVGGRIIKMAELKSCVEAAGVTNVRTLLQSGNVLLDSEAEEKDVRQRLEAAVGQTFDYPAIIFVHRLDKLRPIVEAYPFDSSDEDYQHYVVFMDDGKADQFDAEFGPVDNDVEAMQKGDGVIYWRVRKGMTLRSERSKCFSKAAYKNFNTSRNIKTLRKLLAL